MNLAVNPLFQSKSLQQAGDNLSDIREIQIKVLGRGFFRQALFQNGSQIVRY
jgi:hypothetical protein